MEQNPCANFLFKEVLTLLYIVGNYDDLFKAQSDIPQDVFIKIFSDIALMDAIYGENRDYLSAGGYSLVAQTKQDLLTVLKIFDYHAHPFEWAEKVTDDYISVLYVFNNDFSITIYMPVSICPHDYIDFEEDFIL